MADHGSPSGAGEFVLTDVRVVRPGTPEPFDADIHVRDGVIVDVAPGLAGGADAVVEGGGLLAMPGAVDAHMHFGIYDELSEDIAEESRAALQGGVTTGISYIRTGRYYLNRGGPYAEVFPEILSRSEGRSHCDYGYHVAPIEASHVEEISDLVDDHGVTSFKIFMFYGGHGLHGRSDDQAAFLMKPEGERYDVAHFEFIMRALERARRRFPDRADAISLSLHCETAEIMAAYTAIVEARDDVHGLEAYHLSRPPHSEGLAVTTAAYLAHETGCTNINLLHLSSAKAMDAAMRMAEAFPSVDFRREVTIGHLLADISTANGVYAKVNPPIRPREDVEALWEHVLAGNVSWVVSDHACCREETKVDADEPDDVFLAKAGFGGTEYLLAGLFSEGLRRGLRPGDVARLVSAAPAARFGLSTKGDLAPDKDADIVLLDPDATWTIAAADSLSAQEYTPFEGMEVTGRVERVFLRGRQVFADGDVVGEPTGRYLRRPT
ncbi:MAG: amidohydrolase family protein [Acidimicrobiia bacterium]|nr:amidohydrolase family protein [Acidimicrobiia bacterium]